MPKPDIPPGTKRWVCAAELAQVRAQLDELLAAAEEHLEHGWDRCKDDEALVTVARRIREGGR